MSNNKIILHSEMILLIYDKVLNYRISTTQEIIELDLNLDLLV